jgi:flagellar motor switch protein FliM
VQVERGVSVEKTNGIDYYDFKKPEKMSREFFETAKKVFSDFGKYASQRLSHVMLTRVELKVGTVEQSSFQEFMETMSKVSVMGELRVEPFKSNHLMAVDKQLALEVLELMCGGSISSVIDASEKKVFTDIDLSILEEFLESLLEPYQRAWGEIEEIKASLVSMYTDARHNRNILPHEVVYHIKMEMQFMENRRGIDLCIPYTALERTINQLDSMMLSSKSEVNPKERESMELNIQRIPISLTVSLGETTLSVKEILKLEKGDVIQLETHIHQPLKLYVEGAEYYHVKPGVAKGRYAVELQEELKEGDQ